MALISHLKVYDGSSGIKDTVYKLTSPIEYNTAEYGYIGITLKIKGLGALSVQGYGASVDLGGYFVCYFKEREKPSG